MHFPILNFHHFHVGIPYPSIYACILYLYS
jgi:hypothetical protein